jgi:hypothetical protein
VARRAPRPPVPARLPSPVTQYTLRRGALRLAGSNRPAPRKWARSAPGGRVAAGAVRRGLPLLGSSPLASAPAGKEASQLRRARRSDRTSDERARPASADARFARTEAGVSAEASDPCADRPARACARARRRTAASTGSSSAPVHPPHPSAPLSCMDTSSEGLATALHKCRSGRSADRATAGTCSSSSAGTRIDSSVALALRAFAEACPPASLPSVHTESR